ncbi:hypothetical protein H105_07251 [Trichophyton soudanense CBS 452.61]|uniref:Uncharacterized protein n=1 Tax=Trichophyton soudanense CBS 452.61 TaxID=1215331 RepID=A0A022XJG0_TRISD|nr:hypothetical protein H105_07251 [Trichophyton soudanense CBS 452.61]
MEWIKSGLSKFQSLVDWSVCRKVEAREEETKSRRYADLPKGEIGVAESGEYDDLLLIIDEYGVEMMNWTYADNGSSVEVNDADIHGIAMDKDSLTMIMTQGRMPIKCSR